MDAGRRNLSEMSEETMRYIAEHYPELVNEQGSCGHTFLTAAARCNVSEGLMRWLVDEKGADIQGRTRGAQLTALMVAKAPSMVLFLLKRGADPTLLSGNGWTALMYQCWYARAFCVERLLKDERVIAGIDLQTTGDFKTGCSALHIGCCSPRSNNGGLRMIELLLLNGANPSLLDAENRTPLDILRGHCPSHHPSVTLLERALPPRSFWLFKAREMIDVKQAINEAKAKAAAEEGEGEDEGGDTGDGEKMRKVLATTPPYLKERVQGGQVELPRVGFKQPSDENEEEKQLVAVMKYVVRDRGEYPESGGMHPELLGELLEMMYLG
jgi:hypothetical protein